jgi:hypothetical protein
VLTTTVAPPIFISSAARSTGVVAARAVRAASSCALA